MKIVKIVWNFVKKEYRIFLSYGRHEVHHILHLPMIERIIHPKSRRPMVAIGIGISIMVAGSSLSVYADYICHHVVPLPHVTIDTVAYGLHGLGLFPIARYVDPLWLILFGEAE